MSMRYSPGAKLGAAYTPTLLDVTTRCRFVARFVTVMVAPGTVAPAWSLTTPVIALAAS
jgi:hypothetical protein